MLQSDGYRAYNVHAAKHPGIQQAACWAHVRGNSTKPRQTGQHSAAGPLRAIARLFTSSRRIRSQSCADRNSARSSASGTANPSSNACGRIPPAPFGCIGFAEKPAGPCHRLHSDALAEACNLPHPRGRSRSIPT
ncbi:MAG: transposase [Akkermansiaceae bacterium]|nr:transposase [Akkermansiaceae bacterium]